MLAEKLEWEQQAVAIIRELDIKTRKSNQESVRVVESNQNSEAVGRPYSLLRW